MGRAPGGRAGHLVRELEEALEQRTGRGMKRLGVARRERLLQARIVEPAQDARDTRVRVLHVVDRVVLALLARQRQVEVERGVVAALDEEEAGGVAAEAVHRAAELQEPAAPLR